MGADIALFPEMWSIGYDLIVGRARDGPSAPRDRPRRPVPAGLLGGGRRTGHGGRDHLPPAVAGRAEEHGRHLRPARRRRAGVREGSHLRLGPGVRADARGRLHGLRARHRGGPGSRGRHDLLRRPLPGVRAGPDAGGGRGDPGSQRQRLRAVAYGGPADAGHREHGGGGDGELPGPRHAGALLRLRPHRLPHDRRRRGHPGRPHGRAGGARGGHLPRTLRPWRGCAPSARRRRRGTPTASRRRTGRSCARTRPRRSCARMPAARTRGQSPSVALSYERPGSGRGPGKARRWQGGH